MNPIAWFAMWMVAGLGWLGYGLLSAGDGEATKRIVTAPRVRYETVAIQDVKKGDLILARDEFGREIGYKPVVETYQRVSDHLRVLTFEDETGTKQTIKTTNEHPFWLVNTGKFVKAGDIEPGCKVTGPSGELQTLVATTYEPHPEGIPVYNFKVGGYHTYFVKENGSRGPPVLVHNANYPGRSKGLSALEQPRNALGQWTSRTKPGQAIPGSPSVDDFAAAAERNGFEVIGRGVSVNTPFGRRQYDLVIQDPATGAVTGVEIKSSQSAFRRFDAPARHQFAADRWLNRNGGLQAIGEYEHIFIHNTIKILWEIL